MLQLLVCSLALLAPLVQGEALQKRNSLEARDCPAGRATCATVGTTSYCAPVGWKCCSQRSSAPPDATCCSNGLNYAPAGSYCCTDGSYCRNGATCRSCTPEQGNGGFALTTNPAPTTPATTRAPTVTTTRVVNQLAYYTYTITYYYFSYYYIYVPSITRSTPTSSTVTTTTTVSVYASNSADARSSFNALTATLSLFTPAAATSLPPLPSQSVDVNNFASPTTSRLTFPSPSTSQFTGGGASGAAVNYGLMGSLTAWVMAVVAGGAAVGMFVL